MKKEIMRTSRSLDNADAKDGTVVWRGALAHDGGFLLDVFESLLGLNNDNR